MDTQGVVYIAIGPKAQAEAEQSAASLKKYNDLPVTVISEFDNPGKGARWAKLNIDRLVDYDRVLYLDADTRIHGDITVGFNFLDDWDIAIAPSENQGGEVFKHIKTGERLQTIRELEYVPLQLQAGMMFFHRQRCKQLFELWRQEWLRWQDQDQAALLRAMTKCPMRVWLLGYDWNHRDGKLIQHLFGRCR
jgi:lipopolysaccharide biosynthesis glycosyltransferase